MKRNILLKSCKHVSIALLMTIPLCSLGQSNNLFKIVENYKVGYINDKGVVVIKPVYLNGSDFSDGLAPVRQNGTYGYISPNGQFVIPPKYDYATSFINGIACVYQNGKPNFIDTHENVLFDSSIVGIHILNNKIALVQTRTGAQGIISLETKKLIADTVYQSVGNFNNGVAVVTKPLDKKYGFTYAVIDTSGNMIVNFGKYLRINDYSDGYALVKIKDSADKEEAADGVIDSKGHLLFKRPGKNNSYISEDFHNGLAVISLYKYWIPEKKGVLSTTEKSYEGYINLKGEVVLNDTLNTYLKSFADGRTFMRTHDNAYKIIDTKFNTIGSETFSDVKNKGFRNGYAIVEKEDKWGIIDTAGKFIVEPKYEDIYEGGIIDDYFFFSISGNEDSKLYGAADIHGREIIKPVMESFDTDGFKNGILTAIVNKQAVFFEKTGNVIWKQKPEENKELQTFNIDYMQRGHFYAYDNTFQPYEGAPANLQNTQKSIEGAMKIAKNELSIVVHPEKKDTINGIFNAVTVFVANTTKAGVVFKAQDNRLYMTVQAKNKNGQWRNIEYLPSSWCGNSYHTLTLAQGKYWTFLTPLYEGDFKTHLRIALQYIDSADKSKDERSKREITIYSNEYESSINPGQFWNKKEYYPRGIMDPYND